MIINPKYFSDSLTFYGCLQVFKEKAQTFHQIKAFVAVLKSWVTPPFFIYCQKV